jgi:hypothetical protein
MFITVERIAALEQRVSPAWAERLVAGIPRFDIIPPENRGLMRQLCLREKQAAFAARPH